MAAECAEHVEDNSCLSNLSEVQAAPNNQIEEIIRGESFIFRRLHVIAGNEKFFVAVWSDKCGAFRIINAAGKKLQGQERMGSSAFPEIDLDGIGFPRPAVVRASDDKVDRETADDAGVS